MDWVIENWPLLVLVAGLVAVFLGGKAFGAFAVAVAFLLFAHTAIELALAASSDWRSYRVEKWGHILSGERAILVSAAKLVFAALVGVLGARQWRAANKGGERAA